MTDARFTNEKCGCEGKCRTLRAASAENEAANVRDDNCKDHVPTMEFTGFGKAYVPQQRLCELFSAKDGFIAGTIFPELHKPYKPIWGQNLQNEEGEDFA